MVLDLSLQEPVILILLHVLGRQKVAVYYTKRVLLRAYVGKPGDTVVDDHTDEEIVNIARRDLSKMMTFKGDPDFTIVNRLPKSMPQYHIGHMTQIRNIQNHVKRQYNGLRITGAPFEAVGLPDCIQQGKNAVEELIDEL